MNPLATCLEVATAAALVPGRQSTTECLFVCARHQDSHPSLSINLAKNAWMCGPCGKGGTAYQLAAFIADIDPADKPGVMSWMASVGLREAARKNGAKPKIVEAYPYHDEAGTLLFETVRLEPKDFRQRKPGGAWNLDGVRRVLYRLPELLAADYVFIVEGEKDVDALRGIGLSATCNPLGAGKWLSEYADSFQKHQHVTIIPDNDEAGRKHANFVASSLVGKVASLKILELPGLPPKGDVSDFITHDPESAAEELARLAEAAPELGKADTPPDYIEFAPAFLSTSDPPLKYLVSELLPEGVLALAHGEPRTKKSWFAIEIAIAVACGRAAFGLERFAVAEPMPVLYSSQEDPARAVRERVKRLLVGYDLPYPPLLAFAVHKGIDLDEETGGIWRERLLDSISTHKFRLVIFDPIRRYSNNADKGPAEVQKITKFLRHITVKTGCTVLLDHHDVKPPGNGNQDTRRRSHKASGGDWFAACECPISIEPAGENTSLVSPEDYKFSVDPRPFTFTIQEDESRSWARLSGEDTTAEKAVDIKSNDKILQYLTEHQGASTEAVRKHCGMRGQDVKFALEKLVGVGVVDCNPGGVGRATRWFISGSKE